MSNKYSHFLRNPEIITQILIYIIALVILTSVSFIVSGYIAAICVFLCAVIFAAINLYNTYKRYKNLSGITQEIDKILHGNDKINLDRYTEGELAVLQSEVYKMMLKMREQSSILISEKNYLADSVADISHQIRTPLTSVNLLLSFLSEPDITNERKNEILHEISASLSRVDWLIGTLLKISKLDAGTVKFDISEHSVQSLLKHSLLPLEISLEIRGISLDYKCDEKAVVKCDINWTGEAILNIVKNCMEYSDKGGIISITAESNELFSEIVISDNGHGISDEDLPHIFERFYRSGGRSGSVSNDSVGIGLALSEMIIKNQNGTVRASNNTPTGAKFSIRFYKEIV